MSHDSGFRRGGKDFTHGKPPRPGKRGGKGFEQRMAKRFHDHEKEVQPETAPADEQKTTEQN